MAGGSWKSASFDSGGVKSGAVAELKVRICAFLAQQRRLFKLVQTRFKVRFALRRRVDTPETLAASV